VPPRPSMLVYRRSDAKQTMKMMGARRSARFACRGWIAGRGVHRVGRTSAVSRLVHLRRFPPSRLLAPSRTRRRHTRVFSPRRRSAVSEALAVRRQEVRFRFHFSSTRKSIFHGISSLVLRGLIRASSIAEPTVGYKTSAMSSIVLLEPTCTTSLSRNKTHTYFKTNFDQKN
jgi:hypothetical protein